MCEIKFAPFRLQEADHELIANWICSKVHLLKYNYWYYDILIPLFQRYGGLEDLSAGMQGVLITTSDQEKLCVSEAYSLLNEVYIIYAWLQP